MAQQITRADYAYLVSGSTISTVVSAHTLLLHALAGGIEFDAYIHVSPLPQAEMSLGIGVAVIAGGGLAVVNAYLLVPEKFAGLGHSQANLGPRGPAVARPPDGPHLQPLLFGLIVAIHSDASPVVYGRVTDDVQIAISVDVAKAQAVIHGGGRHVLDGPGLVHVFEVPVARAAQNPKEVATVP